MLTLLLGGAGCGKSYELTNRIESAAEAGKDVLVIIPEQFSFEFDRMLYDRLGAVLFNKLNVLSFTRTAKEIFVKHGGLKGRYADDTVKNVLMYLTLSELGKKGELCFYDRQAQSPAFAESALDIVKELTRSGVSPEEFSGCAESLDESVREKAADIAMIYSEYSRMLSERGYKDSESDITEAARRAEEHDFFSGKTVFIDAFKSFTADEHAMLAVIISQSDDVTVCLPAEEADVTAYSLFETVNRTAGKLSEAARISGVKTEKITLTEPKRFKDPALAFFSKNVMRNIRGRFDGVCSSVRVYRSDDRYGEGDFVASEIRRLVAEEGYKYSETAVLARRKELYSSAVESAFERYGIPFYTDDNRTAAHKPLFVFVKTALAIASGKSTSSEDWLRYMKTGMLGLTDEEIAAVEDCCYKWSVEGEMWEKPFEYDELDISAENIRQRIAGPVLKLRRNCSDTDGRTICEGLLTFFDDVGLYETLRDIYGGNTSADASALSAVREVKQLWELLCGLLETLDRALGSSSISIDDFARIFSLAVSRLKLSSPPQTLDCVRFVASHTARLSEPRAVFIVGANDGEFPFAVKSSGLLNDRDRNVLEDAGIRLSGGAREKLSEERFAAYSALSQASERLFVSYAMSDVSGKQLYPSAAVLQAEEMFGDEVVLSFEKRGLLSFCTTADAAYYQYVQNYRRNDEDSASLYAALDSIPEFSERLRYLRSVEKLSEHSLPAGMGKRLFGEKMYLSASRFEDYQKCPFKYYCKVGLKLYPPQKVQLDVLSRGNVIHYCLCGVLREKSRDEFVSMGRNDIGQLVKKHLDDYYRSAAVGGGYGKTKRYKAAYSRLANTLTDILARLAEEFGQSRFVPEEFEYTLKRSGDEEPLRLVTPNGITVYFEGAVDRIDVYNDGSRAYVRVVDYKSGTKDLRYDDLLYGVNMQMLLYLFAVTDKKSKGRFSGGIPAGVLYMPAKDAVPASGREPGDDGRKKAMNETYKMKGAVLENDGVVRAMERSCGGEFIPVKLTAKGPDRYSKLVTAKQFENLRKYSYELLCGAADRLAYGSIEAYPLRNRDKSLPCAYCEYKSICGNYPPSKAREYDKDAEEMMEKIMNGEV